MKLGALRVALWKDSNCEIELKKLRDIILNHSQPCPQKKAANELLSVMAFPVVGLGSSQAGLVDQVITPSPRVEKRSLEDQHSSQKYPGVVANQSWLMWFCPDLLGKASLVTTLSEC